MNILFIWLGLKGPLDPWRVMCLDRAKVVYPEATFKVITTLDEFGGFEVIKAQDVLDEITKFEFDIMDHFWVSDYLRLHWLSTRPNTLYLDTDTWCIKPITTSAGMGNAGFEAIWNGTELDKIQDVLDLVNHKMILFRIANKFNGDSLTQYFEHKPGWSKLIRRPDLQ